LEAPRMKKNVLLAAVSAMALCTFSANVWADGSDNDTNAGSVVGVDNDHSNANSTAGNDNKNSHQQHHNSSGETLTSPSGSQNGNIHSVAVGEDWLQLGNDGVNASNGHNSAVAGGDALISISALSANVSNNPIYNGAAAAAASAGAAA